MGSLVQNVSSNAERPEQGRDAVELASQNPPLEGHLLPKRWLAGQRTGGQGMVPDFFSDIRTRGQKKKNSRQQV